MLSFSMAVGVGHMLIRLDKVELGAGLSSNVIFAQISKSERRSLPAKVQV